MIASHYAEPLLRRIAAGTEFRSAPEKESELLGSLRAGEGFRMLDSSRGWAWGYARDGRVGYVPAGAISA